MEEEALYIGLSLAEFWDLTPKTYEKYARAFERRKKSELQEQDYLNHLLGHYIAYAVNDPKKYPKKPFLHEEKQELRTMSMDEMERKAMQNTLIMGGEIHDS